MRSWGGCGFGESDMEALRRTGDRDIGDAKEEEGGDVGVEPYGDD